jgi:hypothetical protein
MTTTRGRLHLCSILTFNYAGLRQCSLYGRRHGLGLGEGSGLFGSWRRIFFSCCAGFISLPGQVCRLPAQYTIGCQPSTTANLHVLLGKDLHLQARPDNSHGRGAKYAGNVDKPGFSWRLFFGFSCRWLFSSRGCGWLRPALSNWRPRLDFCSRPLRHELFHGGGWTAASLSRLPDRLPVAFVPLVYAVGRQNLLQALRILLSAYTTLQDKYSTTLLEEFTS